MMPATRFLHPKKQTVTASAVSGKSRRDPGCKAEDCAGRDAELGRWRCARGVTVAGAKEHVAPAGSPEHAKLTGESNPFFGVTVSVTAHWPPESTMQGRRRAKREVR